MNILQIHFESQSETSPIIYFVYLAAVIIGLVILYYIIKTAVKNGVIEARLTRHPSETSVDERITKLKSEKDNYEKYNNIDQYNRQMKALMAEKIVKSTNNII